MPSVNNNSISRLYGASNNNRSHADTTIIARNNKVGKEGAVSLLVLRSQDGTPTGQDNVSSYPITDEVFQYLEEQARRNENVPLDRRKVGHIESGYAGPNRQCNLLLNTRADYLPSSNDSHSVNNRRISLYITPNDVQAMKASRGRDVYIIQK
jgi:hypothetical protein